VNLDFNPTIEITDVVLPEETKTILNEFFSLKKVFSVNDVKRMYDTQYIMLISSTILEGNYFGRNSKIEFYLKKYNLNFEAHDKVIFGLLNSINIINQFKFPVDSYWFNKANLFTLLIELNKLNSSDIDLEKMELKLLELAKKVDIYFTDEDISIVNDDERKYFEYSRQGSHELAARLHRGLVIQKIIEASKVITEVHSNDELVQRNITFLDGMGTQYSILTPTETGLNKSIMDAVSSVREFFAKQGIHDYEPQDWGPENKEILIGQFNTSVTENRDTNISLYRSQGRGDYRIWFSDLKNFAEAGDKLVIKYVDSQIEIMNISKTDYTTTS
jgi:hypothetical protein